ncbi:MAG: hypothetical protein AAF560_10725 [Acidobacteriota bacterium]
MTRESTWLIITVLGWMVFGTSTAHGDDVQVNTYTTGDQGEPRVARGADGSFAVVWSSNGSAGTDDSVTSIQAQRHRGALGVWRSRYLQGSALGHPLNAWKTASSR